jgi:hypothetical protein
VRICASESAQPLSVDWLQMCIGGVALPLASAVDCAPCNVGEQRKADGVCTACADG